MGTRCWSRHGVGDGIEAAGSQVDEIREGLAARMADAIPRLHVQHETGRTRGGSVVQA